MKIWYKLRLSFCSARVFVFLTNCFHCFIFSQRVLCHFIGKILFRRIEGVTWRYPVLSISQNSSENTCVGVLSFSKVVGYRPATTLKRDSCISAFLGILKKTSRKNSIADVWLGSKYALSSGRYWVETLIVEKNWKSN